MTLVLMLIRRGGLTIALMHAGADGLLHAKSLLCLSGHRCKILLVLHQCEWVMVMAAIWSILMHHSVVLGELISSSV